MKGPYERLKYDLRRVWECPECHHRERTGGEASGRWCKCQDGKEPTRRVAMKLAEDGVRCVLPTAAEIPPVDPSGVARRS